MTGQPPRPLAWSSTWEVAKLICTGATFRVSARVALVVGTLLSIVNQGSVLAGGSADGVTWLRVVANYAIPYAVSGVGYLAPFRQAHQRGSATSTGS